MTEPTVSKHRVKQTGMPHGMYYIIPAVLSTLMTLMVLTPMAYLIHRNMPRRVAIVDLQSLVEEQQKHILSLINKSEEITSEQYAMAEKMTIDFTKKLSITLDRLGKECHCVIVNKAALLGGVTIDYTDQVRERIK